jgi:hypothetical protein
MHLCPHTDSERIVFLWAAGSSDLYTPSGSRIGVAVIVFRRVVDVSVPRLFVDWRSLLYVPIGASPAMLRSRSVVGIWRCGGALVRRMNPMRDDRWVGESIRGRRQGAGALAFRTVGDWRLVFWLRKVLPGSALWTFGRCRVCD